MDCLFCKIADGEIESNILYQDELVLAFEDINPQAPTHTLIIPKRHIPTVNDLTQDDNNLVGHMLQVAKNLAKDADIAEDGYRLLLNCNANGGQEVYHIHLHLLGGRALQWPPG